MVASSGEIIRKFAIKVRLQMNCYSERQRERDPRGGRRVTVMGLPRTGTSPVGSQLIVALYDDRRYQAAL